jgi:glycosyltransferase involved in cell wall biosynthesis
MGEAILTFVPTLYIEPFGGVAVEAMMTGCPVLTTDWGAFSENVLHGITGFKCHTLDDFLWSAKHIEEIDRIDCRNWALKNFSMERVRHMYNHYFKQLYNLWYAGSGSGWYKVMPGHDVPVYRDWLRRYFP